MTKLNPNTKPLNPTVKPFYPSGLNPEAKPFYPSGLNPEAKPFYPRWFKSGGDVNFKEGIYVIKNNQMVKRTYSQVFDFGISDEEMDFYFFNINKN